MYTWYKTTKYTIAIRFACKAVRLLGVARNIEEGSKFADMAIRMQVDILIIYAKLNMYTAILFDKRFMPAIKGEKS